MNHKKHYPSFVVLQLDLDEVEGEFAHGASLVTARQNPSLASNRHLCGGVIR